MLVIGLASCAGGQTGELPTDQGVPSSADTARCKTGGDCGSHPPNPFSDLVGGGSSRCIPASDLDQLTSTASVVMVGDLVAVAEGRKEYLGAGCDVGEDETGPCSDMVDPMFYASHVNLVVRPHTILKGTLEAPQANVHVEFPWPRNVAIDGLVASAPIGSRVILVGSWVRDARAQAKPFEDAGLLPPGSVADNLTRVGCYGPAFEYPSDLELQAHDGINNSPTFGGTKLALLIDPSGMLRFDDAVEALARSVRSAP